MIVLLSVPRHAGQRSPSRSGGPGRTRLAQPVLVSGPGGQDNVARWAHIGGFFAGMAMIYVFPHVKRPPRAVPVYNRDEDDADFVL